MNSEGFGNDTKAVIAQQKSNLFVLILGLEKQHEIEDSASPGGFR